MKLRYTIIKPLGPLIVIIFSLMTFGSLQSCSESCSCNSMNSYFEKIRNDEAALTAFFSGMPKGGDLHNHYSGSVYTETYWNALVENNALIDTISLSTDTTGWKDMDAARKKRFLSVEIIKARKKLAEMKQRVLQYWSIKDYYDAYAPSDKHFFDAFAKFPNTDRKSGLKELKDRAIAENVQYLEIMIGGGYRYKNLHGYRRYDTLLWEADKISDTPGIKKHLAFLYQEFEKMAKDSAEDYAKRVKNDHANIDESDGGFTMRFLIAPGREGRPVDIFKSLITGFETVLADTSVFVGINFVAPEYGEFSMQDYKLHMQMFDFLHKKYSNVKISLHAGELTLGVVKPEDLTFHIHDAVFTGKANRIGHGVDIAFEKDYQDILRKMKEDSIAIEINLFSNEFILKVKDDKHPVMLYKKNRVPIVICTDDAGILRTNLVHQYVLLAKRYKDISYDDIKTIITNSIRYSFYSDSKKQERIKSLEKKINAYEKQVLASSKY